MRTVRNKIEWQGSVWEKTEWLNGPNFHYLTWLPDCAWKLVNFVTLNVQLSKDHCSKALIKLMCLHKARHNSVIPKKSRTGIFEKLLYLIWWRKHFIFFPSRNSDTFFGKGILFPSYLLHRYVYVVCQTCAALCSHLRQSQTSSLKHQKLYDYLHLDYWRLFFKIFFVLEACIISQWSNSLEIHHVSLFNIGLFHFEAFRTSKTFGKIP